MAMFSTALLLGLVAGACADSQIIRRQMEDMAVGLSSAGELRAAKVSPHSLLRTEPELKADDLCDDDYPLGLADSNGCVDPDNHTLIDEDALCRSAAADVRATIDHNTFLVPTKYQEHRPKGCFIAACHTNGDEDAGEHHNTTASLAQAPGKCVFYNPIGDNATNPVGTPLCTRKKYLLGKVNTNGIATDCPTGYHMIVEKDQCITASGCTPAPAANVGSPIDRQIPLNHSKHDEFPEGCFIDTSGIGGVHHHVFFNAPLASFVAPTAPVGIPVCKVSTFTKCDTDCNEISSDSVVTHLNHTVLNAPTTDAPTDAPTEAPTDAPVTDAR